MSKVTCSRWIAYYRLSEKDKRDKKKAISDSIENQKKLIREYVSHQENAELVDEFFDDGYTGTNYDRPGFIDLLNAIKAGRADCIVVKDLSRLGREYIETGKLLEQIFPSMGIRFVSVNDGYDSSCPKQSDDILIPIKNLMNETYCRELSYKLRRQFAVQRGNGEFLGAFASYGYCKSPDDKHKLVIDEYAAGIVKGIFYSKMQGYSQQAIANTLNAEGVLSPAQYKKHCGYRYKSGFTTEATPMWTAVAVTRILVNRIYIGDLIQGKRGTPNFKIKKEKLRKPEEWVVVENNHEPIVDFLVFEVVQRMLTRDTRCAPTQTAVTPLSGMVFCADCGRSVLIRSVTRSKKKFLYYVCSTYKNSQGCSSHSIEKNKLETAILNAVRIQIQTVVNLDEIIAKINLSDIHDAKLKKLRRQLAEKEKELEGYREFKDRLLEALTDNLIEKDEYTRMRDKYRALEDECDAIIESLHEKISSVDLDGIVERTWVDQFAKYNGVQELTREMVVTLIDRIIIHEDKRIEIVFNFKDELAYYRDIIANTLKEVS